MIRTRAATILLLMLLISTALPSLATAQQNVLNKVVPCDGTSLSGTECTVCHLATLAQNILNTAIYIAVFLSAILFAWAGWVYMTAMGNMNKTTKAKKVFTNVAIGLVIILMGWLVVDTIMRTLVGGNTEFGPWNSICPRA